MSLAMPNSHTSYNCLAMAKGSKPKGRAAPKPAGKKEKLREEDFDEIDTFHKDKDAIHGLSVSFHARSILLLFPCSR